MGSFLKIGLPSNFSHAAFQVPEINCYFVGGKATINRVFQPFLIVKIQISKQMKNLFVGILITTLLIVSLGSCARQGTPNGGPKDTIAPVMVAASPKYKSVHFKEKRIQLEFDEYVKFKNLFKQLIVSPPLENPLVIKPLGYPSKRITIDIQDTLKQNTTYSLNFGNSIIDNNEGNPLGSFKYVFSTGAFVDSLEIRGTLKNALEKDTDGNLSVLLYEYNENYRDSLIYNEKPIYVTNTLDTTSFRISNIKKGTYKLVALKDFNNNFQYNPKQDKIGFLNKPIAIPTDSTFELQLFKEIPDFKVFKPLENKIGKIIFGFEGKRDRLLQIALQTKTPPLFKSFVNLEENKDTLNYWYTPFETDSLQFHVTAKNIDTLYTVKLRTSKTDSLVVRSATGTTLHPKDTFAIQTNIPIDHIDTKQIRIVDKDTLLVPFQTFLDANKTKLSVRFNSKRNDKYRVDLLPNALVDFQGETNDSLQFNLKTLDFEDYGTIEMELKNVTQFPVLVDLLDTKEKRIERQSSNQKTNFSFENIVPGTYLIRVIYDSNKNKKWDTGSFLKQQQPEKVFHYPIALKIKANWTISEIFDLSLETANMGQEESP